MDILITDSRDEQSFEDLFGDTEQIHIPIFQREYVWGDKELKNLCSDVVGIQEALEKSQFLGAIVSYERVRMANINGRMKVLDIVDGQQRLLTLYIFVLAIAERLFFYDEVDAKETVQELLLLRPRRGLEINTRVVPSQRDRTQFRALWDRVNSPELMQEILQDNPPKPPLPSGTSTGNLEVQYGRIISWLKKVTPREPSSASQHLKSILDIITRKLTFVHLKLTDASVATKIFERLNFRGIRVGIGDLVRNEVFARSEQNANVDIELYETVWKPFEGRLRDREDAFYFAYCLIHNSNIKKSELFTELRGIWKGYDPVTIVKHMEPYQSVFLKITAGEPNYEDRELNGIIINLHRLKIPSATYPFVMQVLYQIETGSLHIGVCKAMLRYLEAFIVRRGILGFEPTGLHALFKGLWNDIQTKPTLENLKAEVAKRHTIQVPSDKELREATLTRPLAKSKVCSYILIEYDKHLPGDNPSDQPTIEHILPQSYEEGSEWTLSFNKEEHKQYRDTLANLIPLSAPLNSSIQRTSYEKKRTRYLAESMYATPRLLAEQWQHWNPVTIEERAVTMYDWIKERWKI